MTARRLASAGELAPLLADDAYARYELDSASPGLAWLGAGAAAWVRRGHHRAGGWLTVLGEPSQAAALAEAILADDPGEVTGLTLPQGAHALLSPQVAVGEGDDWVWWWTSTPPAAQPGEEAVRWLDDVDDGALAQFLAEASPRSSAPPGSPAIRRWCGVPGAGAGGAVALDAIAAHVEYRPGVPHLASIAVRPQRRGSGLGGAVTAWLTRALLAAGAPVVTLGMYADNEPARRVYERLGFTDSHHFSSRRLLLG